MRKHNIGGATYPLTATVPRDPAPRNVRHRGRSSHNAPPDPFPVEYRSPRRSSPSQERDLDGFTAASIGRRADEYLGPRLSSPPAVLAGPFLPHHRCLRFFQPVEASRNLWRNDNTVRDGSLRSAIDGNRKPRSVHSRRSPFRPLRDTTTRRRREPPTSIPASRTTASMRYRTPSSTRARYTTT